MGKKHVKIRRLNWDVMFFNSLQDGNGFIISEPVSVNFNGVKEKTLYGPRSELYGTTYGDEQEFAEQCRCQCGRFKGRMLEGEICPFCGKEVKAEGDDITITGWISLGKERIINPYYYQLLSSVIGKAVFPDIITPRKKVDKDGNISIPDIYADKEKPPLSPYSGIGVNEFRQRYYEIMDYFASKKKNKYDKIEILKRNVRSVFTSHIPIYSTKLRQQSVTSDTFYYTGLDREINSLIPLTNLLQEDECTEIEKPNYLHRIQKKVNKMWDYNFDLLNGKEGLIRGQLLGGSLGFIIGGMKTVLIAGKIKR